KLVRQTDGTGHIVSRDAEVDEEPVPRIEHGGAPFRAGVADKVTRGNDRVARDGLGSPGSAAGEPEIWERDEAQLCRRRPLYRYGSRGTTDGRQRHSPTAARYGSSPTLVSENETGPGIQMTSPGACTPMCSPPPRKRVSTVAIARNTVRLEKRYLMVPVDSP